MSFFVIDPYTSL